jgi:queuine tRNA-ribosyltransferase
MKPNFKIVQKDKKTKARAGIIKTLHGDIETPIFVPVGTNSSVKSVSPRDLKEMGAQIVLANTYHLHLRPGEDLIKKFGGLSKWMSWGKPTMTDSGGFQVFSLGIGLEHGVGKLMRDEATEARPRLNKITPEGVTFQSHLDGSTQFLSPESSIKIQEKLGADLIVAFDDLESPKYDHEET